MTNKPNKPGKTFLIIAATILVLLVCGASCCKLIDNSEVGIKFKKFSLTDQGKLITQPIPPLRLPPRMPPPSAWTPPWPIC